MSSAPRVRVLFDEDNRPPHRGSGAGGRPRETREPARRRGAQGKLHVRGRPDPGAAPGRPRAAGRVHPSLELSRRDGVVRTSGDPAGCGERRARPRRAARRRYPRIGPDRRLRQGSPDGAGRQARHDRPCSWKNPASGRSSSTPTSSASPARMSSWSDMAWTWRIPSANCPSSASSIISTGSRTCSEAP